MTKGVFLAKSKIQKELDSMNLKEHEAKLEKEAKAEKKGKRKYNYP